MSSKAKCFWALCPLCPFIWSYLVTTIYLVNGLSNFDESFRECLLVPTGYLIRFWGPKVKVTEGGQAVHIEAGASKSCLLVSMEKPNYSLTRLLAIVL